MSTEYSNSDHRIDKLESRYGHLDDQLSKQGREISGINATLTQFGQTLSDISEKVNQPPNSTNWWALISAMVALVVVFGQGVNMLVNPLAERQDDVAAVIVKFSELHMDQADSLATLSANERRDRDEITRLDSLLRESGAAIATLQQKSAASEVSRKAIGDYVKEHVNGSDH